MSTCKICMEPYKKPFMLPCGHSFCQKCLIIWSEEATKKSEEAKSGKEEGGAVGGSSQSVRPGTMSCPSCQTVHQLPEGGVGHFSQNLDYMAAENVCCICDENEAAFKCLECEEWFCKPCKIKTHDSIKKNRNHSMFTVEQVSKGEMKTKYQCCSKHGNKIIDLYCTVCREPCCLTGGATIHKQHECITLDEHHEQFRDQLVQEREKISKLVEDFKGLYDKWKTYEKSRSEDKEVIVQEVEQKRIEAHKKVDKNADDFLKWMTSPSDFKI